MAARLRMQSCLLLRLGRLRDAKAVGCLPRFGHIAPTVSMPLPSAARRFQATATSKAMKTVEEELLEYDEDEDEAEEDESLLPPWRQLKPWRWEQANTEAGFMGMFNLPHVETDEAGRSYIIGIFAFGVVVFFCFVWWGPPEARAPFRFTSARRDGPAQG
ncbi:AKT2 [Symbiodinium sp. CCMP2592]|nr:AKT2 [Symbiodinium sp. CCMP2592]